MSEKKYTAADFAAAKFATKDDVLAIRTDPDSAFPWMSRQVGGGFGGWHSDEMMSVEGFAPVPPTPAKPTITAGEVGRRSHLVRGGNVETPSLVDFLEALGIEVVPDPVPPTNAERLADVLIDLGHPEPRDYARRLDEAGVTGPGGEA